VGNPGWLALAAQSDGVDEVHSLDRLPVHAGFQESPSQEHSLFRFLSSYDLVVSWFGDREGRWERNLMRACGGRVLVRSFQEHRSFQGHASDFYLASLEEVGVAAPENVLLPFWPRPLLWDPERLACFRKGGQGTEEQTHLCLHPGSGSKAKNWPKERFLEVAQTVRQQWKIPVRVLLGEAEGDQQAFWKKARDRGIFLEAGRSLPEVAGILSRSLLYVGNDSGITHLAASLGVPSVAIFGPTDPNRYAPRGSRVRVLFKGEKGCQMQGAMPSSDGPSRTLLLISTDEVLEALKGFL